MTGGVAFFLFQTPPVMRRILVIHPALGTGGGSRWSLQAAEALAQRGHTVEWVAGAPTQESPAWPELSAVSFHRHLVPLRWPETVAGRGRAALATWRTRGLIRWSRRTLPEPDAVLLDSVPFELERVRAAFPSSRIVFYCHFPEALYAKPAPWYLRAHRQYWVRREAAGLAVADQVLANSDYTRTRLISVFPELAGRVTVCHPAVRGVAAEPVRAARHVLCVARWDLEKNLPLAVRAYAECRRVMSAAGGRALPLVIVGGFDAKSPLAQAAWDEVARECVRLGLDDAACRRLRGCSDVELDRFYREALVLVHPAPREHFGMVAPEAMVRGIPVIGIAGSGLAETVIDGETGFLVPPETTALAGRLRQLHEEPGLRDRLGARARARVEASFLLEHQGGGLEAALFPR